MWEEVVSHAPLLSPVSEEVALYNTQFLEWRLVKGLAENDRLELM